MSQKCKSNNKNQNLDNTAPTATPIASKNYIYQSRNETSIKRDCPILKNATVHVVQEIFIGFFDGG
jgi:hypothetical protein